MKNVAEISMRDKVIAIEVEMFKFPQLEIIPKHYFAHGAYAREITIPANSTVTGKIHKYSQINILSKGDISVLTEDGIIRVQAPFTIVSPPGTKRIAYAHTECVWTTILGTDEKDPDKIEAHFIAQSEDEYMAYCKKLELEATKCLT